MKMRSRSMGLFAHSPRERCGFTLIELLVIVGLLMLLAGLLIPVFQQVRHKSQLAQCRTNLKQIGSATTLFADDHAGRLPGSVELGVSASYDVTYRNELAWYLAPYLGYPAPAKYTTIAKPLICPAYALRAPNMISMIGRRSYLLTANLATNSAEVVRPFGDPLNPTDHPLTLAALSAFGSPGQLGAATDVDKGNVDPKVSWWADLPYQPVHGPVRNQLYFDGHVEMKPW